MGRQNEFYKKTHPEQFSDSVLVKKGNLSRDMFDYGLYIGGMKIKTITIVFIKIMKNLWWKVKMYISLLI